MTLSNTTLDTNLDVRRMEKVGCQRAIISLTIIPPLNEFAWRMTIRCVFRREVVNDDVAEIPGIDNDSPIF